jgi:propanol-preferring alcohol dehydrogenase
MRAWRMTGTGEPLVRSEVPEPSAAPGEVVIDVNAAGLCHSDVGALEDPGWMEIIQFVPITLGHEVAGVISEVGEGVTDFRVGDRVGICPSTPTLPGYHRDGGYADKATARQEDIVRVPEGVSFEQAAAGTDAGMTSYHAVVVAGRVEAGNKVGIIGLGGLGQIGARVAVVSGAELYAAELREEVWPLGRDIGVREVTKDIRDFADVGLEVIVDFAGFGTTTAAAIETVRPGGRVVQIGMGRLEATINTRVLIVNNITLVGSSGGDVDDIAAVYWLFWLFAEGKLTPTLTTIGFEEIAEGLERLKAGTVQGRLVATIDG